MPNDPLVRALQLCEQLSELAAELRKVIAQRPAPILTHDGVVIGVIGPHCTDDPPSRPA